MRFSDPARLVAEHDVETFDCGAGSLNEWLQRHARRASGVGSAQTFVACDEDQGGRVVGYYALTVGSVTHRDATDRVRKGMPRHPIPVALLARLAVDISVQGRGIGAWMLRDALLRVVGVAEQFGLRALIVHALGDESRAFYAHLGFEASPTDPHNMQILLPTAPSTARGSPS